MNIKTRPGHKGRAGLAALLAVAALAAGAAVAPRRAQAMPAQGLRAPNASVEDADGRKLEMESLRGRPILIVYEDEASLRQNQALKDKLEELAKEDQYRRTVALAAVADVSEYDFWPAKGAVKDVVRKKSEMVGAPIYCDWSGEFRAAYGLRPGVSNVVLLSREGHVLFAAEGAMNPDAQQRLLGLLRKEVEG